MNRSPLRKKDRGFSRYTHAYYARAGGLGDRVREEVMIGFYPIGGGTCGEFAVRWMDIGPHVTPRLEVFDDAWRAFIAMPELHRLLKRHADKNISPDDFCAELVRIGLKDCTARTQQ